MSFLGFGAPLILIALVVLPIIWFLLRTTPPKPSHEPFPPLNILRQIVKEEQSAHKTPWWLVLLRLILAAMIILALAQPLVNPRPLLVSSAAPLILMIDNGFAAQIDWQDRVGSAKQLIDSAQTQDLPIYIIATAEPANVPIGPYRGAEAQEIIDALSVRTISPDRMLAVNKLAEVASDNTSYQIAYLSDGLASGNDTVLARLNDMTKEAILWYQSSIEGLVGIKTASNDIDMMRLQGLRANPQGDARYMVVASDGRGRRLGETEMAFTTGQRQAQAELTLPVEIRNDIVSLKVEEGDTAAATYLTSTADKRRRIALFGVETREIVQPLLTPLYYPMRALAPFGDLVLSDKKASGEAIVQLLDANPSLLVVADELSIPPTSHQRIMRWLDTGGTLLRFAGPRLAASGTDDGLLPVRLRRGERTMGGAMSWRTPQKIAAIDRQSPLFGLNVPENITISRQILAEPEPQLFDKSWLNLEDGTPLVTAEMRGRGKIIFIHTTAAPDWSNMALSGFFVEMLQRFVISANAPTLTAEMATNTETSANDNLPQGMTRHLPPWRILSADGHLLPPPTFVLPLEIQPFGEMIKPDFSHPPGLYGTAEGEQVALNLLGESSQFEPLAIPTALNIIPQPYEENHNLPLEGILWAMALILFTIDCLIMLGLSARHGGKNIFSFLHHSRKKIVAHAAIIAVSWLISCLYLPQVGMAQADDATMLAERAAKTHLAYVITGNLALDDLSHSGLEALSQFIAARTTIEPGAAIGVDLAQDDLSFYPLLYWPVDATTALPNDEAIARLGTYMRQGGAVLFDTRDQLESGLGFDGAATANSAHLRRILENLDIPPLEPAPADHVVARSFYIMQDFPGRYRGSDLWLEALPLQANQDDDTGWLNYPPIVPIVRAGDGVSPILITANDFIGAWARNAHDDWFYPTVPDEPAQRLWAFRAGLNIVMYLLSGNYKADQVHAPELLQRLGN